ncbi:MAG: 2Fe-2S iron-sulfur cluster-binding protein [Bryobacteraceae bacterium]|jgi:sarcosine oxidase subunit alpha
MSKTVRIVLNGEDREVPAGATLASALLGLGLTRFRTSVHAEPRAPLCGMGVCQECRVTVDGRMHVRACLLPCRESMRVETDLL